jgi:hypothetical protein
MYEDLIKFIEICLVDGVISEKEKEIILLKGEKINISVEECEILIDSLIFKNSNKNINEKTNENKYNNDLVYFTDVDDLNRFIEIIERNNNKLKEVDQSFKIKFKKWKDENLKNLILSLNNEKYKSGDIFYLEQLLKKNIFFNSTIEYRLRNEIKNILSTEEVIGYITYHNEWYDKETNHEYDHMYGILFTKDKIFKFTTRITEDNIECYNFDTPFLFIIGSWFDGIQNLLSKIDFFSEPSFSFVDEVVQSKLLLNTHNFEDILSNSSLDDTDLKNLMILSNYINRYIEDYNLYLGSINKYNLGVKDGKYLINNLPNIYELFQHILNSISYISTLLIYRDQLFFYYRTNNKVNSHKIYNFLEDKGVFQNKFQREILQNLGNINNSLLKINNSLIQGFENLSESLNGITNSLNNISGGLHKINSNLEIGNFVNMIQTYQMYKINKNTKRIG